MRITRVQLRNIKSYANGTSVAFAPGINAICGPNGAGKSTLLEAIGLALFDALPYNQKQFVREGAKQGEIVVSFISALDGREYQAVRPLGGGQPYAYDPELQVKLVTGKADVLLWLKDHLGVDRTGNLETLFNDAVGVPQGLLTAAFLESPRDRKRKFDGLLQIDDYQKAWENLRETTNLLEEDLNERQRRLDALNASLRRLPEVQQRAQELRDQIRRNEERLREVQSALEEAQARRQALDALQERVRQAASEAGQAASALQLLTDRLERAQRDLDEARAAQEILQAAEPGYRRYEEAARRIKELEVKRRERDALARKRADAETSVALAGQQIEQLGRQLDAIREAEERMAALEPAVREQEKWEQAQADADRDARLLVEAQKRLDGESERLARLEAERKRVETALAELHAVEAEMEAQQIKYSDAERQSAQLAARLQSIQERRRQLQDTLRLLSVGELSHCPVCNHELGATDAEALREHHDADLKRLADEEAAAQKQRRAADAAAQEARWRWQEAQKAAARLPRATRLDELDREIADQQARVTEEQQRVQRLAAAPAALENARRRLQELGDPRRAYNQAQAHVQSRPALETQLERAQDRLDTCTEERDALDTQLQALAGLDDRLEEERATQASTAADHRRYLEHRQAAAALPGREAEVASLGEQVEQARARNDERQRAYEALQAQYDPAAHQEAVATDEALRAEQSGLEARIAADRDQQQRNDAELQELNKQEQDRVIVEKERKSLRRLADALEFVRKTIRDAGPHVAQELVRNISAEADQIFGDIVNDHTMRLQWTEDYGIRIEQRGNERDFSQLSGGEKVASALAVRLALLRRMSNIRVAFFDEPTAHLDDERRENLAAQITRIRGFNQLFVISHDDTFERETHHVVRVSKQDGESRVEVD